MLPGCIQKKEKLLKDRITFADVCNHLGSIYLVLHQPDKSLDFHRKALAIRSEMGNTEGMAKSHNNVGETFFLSPETR
ncbi:MAG: hypothetical protein HC905_11180 [Bacteroidales bacterium]|nr:hypothetical protein [Bacteroidales bacterium]